MLSCVCYGYCRDPKVPAWNDPKMIAWEAAIATSIVALGLFTLLSQYTLTPTVSYSLIGIGGVSLLVCLSRTIGFCKEKEAKNNLLNTDSIENDNQEIIVEIDK